MNIKHVVAVVAVVAQICVETVFPFSLDVKGEKNQTEPRQRGNATSPHPSYVASCQVNKPSIQHHSH